MTTNEIEDVLIRDLSRRSFPIFLTTFSGRGIQEADVIGINQNDFMYEYEIKRSMSDYYSEFANKKHKHKNLSERHAFDLIDEWKNGKKTGLKIEFIKIPNRYFFVCIDGLIPVHKIPKYAGLVYINPNTKELREIKPAPLLHKIKANTIIYQRVAQVLSQRIIYGCSYYSYKANKANKEMLIRQTNLNQPT